MLKLFSETKFRVGHSPLLISVSQEAAECYYITIHMNAFFRENVSLILAESSSNAFFAHLTPSGTAIIQAHSIPWGTEQKGTERRGRQGIKKRPCNWNTRDLAVRYFQHGFLLLIQHVQYCITFQARQFFSIGLQVSKGAIIFWVIIFDQKFSAVNLEFSGPDRRGIFQGLMQSLKWQQLSSYFLSLKPM